MRGLDKTVKTTINAHFDNSQWELYDDPKTDEAVAEINEQLNFLVNSGFDRNTVDRRMHDFLNKFKDLGALDTEPRAFLRYVLDEIFGASTGAYF